MTILKQIMNLQNVNEDVFKCKGAALENILLFASKYKEDVEAVIRDFSQEIWTLSANASDDQEYDNIVLNCLKYFKSLMMWPDMKGFFSENMLSLFQSLIIPNIFMFKNMRDLFDEEV
jgi:exportin-2 (importin alpha re-exporter)